MKTTGIWIIVLFYLPFVKAQNLTACDTLTINCCSLDSVNSGFITLMAANNSTVLFDYPGFLLLDDNLDTIAKETVNYFGIGTFPQTHRLNLTASLALPFTGELQLFSGFFSSLDCTFPVYITDTITEINEENESPFFLFPNPARDEVKISAGNSSLKEVRITLWNGTGQQIFTAIPESFPVTLPLQLYNAGIYFIMLHDEKGTWQVSKKLIIPKH